MPGASCLLVVLAAISATCSSLAARQQRHGNLHHHHHHQLAEVGPERAPTTAFPDILVHKPVAQHTATIIMLHGLGQTAAEWQHWGPDYQRELPYVKWMFPTAPRVSVTWCISSG